MNYEDALEVWNRNFNSVVNSEDLSDELKEAIFRSIDALCYLVTLEKGPVLDEERDLFEFYKQREIPKVKVIDHRKVREFLCGGVCNHKIVSTRHAYCYECGQRLFSDKYLMEHLFYIKQEFIDNCRFDEYGMLEECPDDT